MVALWMPVERLPMTPRLHEPVSTQLLQFLHVPLSAILTIHCCENRSSHPPCTCTHDNHQLWACKKMRSSLASLLSENAGAPLTSS